jgi:NADH-quinone oxidoreductase subunit E
MWYLISEIWFLLAVAFALGWFAHWFICCRNTKTDNLNQTRLLTDTQSSETKESSKPEGFAHQPDTIDDLKRIKGIGSVIEETLNGLGVYQFQQIARWDDNNVLWIENLLSFPGRIDREQWIDQARTLSAGGSTEFSNRVDNGGIEYEDQ